MAAANPAIAGLSVGDLRCENRINPLGIDATRPRLSWILQATGRCVRQTAYQVLVASSARKLQADVGNLWNSGKVGSDQSIQLPYVGKSLDSSEVCFWKVRVWDNQGRASAWSAPARWSMGLLNPEDWRGKWIGWDEGKNANSLRFQLLGAKWIWFPEGNPAVSAPVGTRYFRRVFDLPANQPVREASITITADNEFDLFVNGREVGNGENWMMTDRFAVSDSLKPGQNVLAVEARNVGSGPTPAGLIARLNVSFKQGKSLTLETDTNWKSAKHPASGWDTVAFDDAAWPRAKALGDYGMQPWGKIQTEDRGLPARYLRCEFMLEKKVRRAMVYFCGLGWSELYVNGRRVGNAVLSPPLSEYPKRAYYVTYDVTKQLRRGTNALGLILGNGRFYAPRLKIPIRTISFGYPKLLLQLRLEFDDGSVSNIVSDGSWRISTNGPIIANNEYDGDEYDARKAFHVWSRPGFDDSKWQPAQIVSPPGGVLSAIRQQPISVTQFLKPVSVSELKPGVFVFDMGQDMVGWCRLKVRGPAGTRIQLRFAETLKPDGELNTANLRSAKQTDTYILNGQGIEIWEPRFTLHGFRYVEMTGFTGRPTLNSLTGCAINDDLSTTGDFECSNPLLNRIYHNVVWGVRDNYRSIPSDMPRDERQGWLGDRAEESLGETFFFDNQALYEKWLQDMADSQKPDGSIPDVCPAYWPIYNDDVSWPSTSIIIPEMLYRQYGNSRIIMRHYDCMNKWIKHMEGFVTNGIISKDSYGDWCAPPRNRTRILTADPNRITSGTLIATAYFYHDLRLMARYAVLLGKIDEAQHFQKQAEKMKAAFNAKFLNRQLGRYANGTQTSCILPLAFGLAPADIRLQIFKHLVHKISAARDHLETGLVGGHYLMRVLTANGRADLAYKIATQTTYPSWGYMVEHGATTIWELWDGNTANSEMSSRNIVMLIGDLATWLYEDLAGIEADSDHPGFKHIIMDPHPVCSLKWVKAKHFSPYGWIVSDWEKNKREFIWRIQVPVNTTATIYLPTDSVQAVTEGGRSVLHSSTIRFLRTEAGRVVFQIGSGHYDFVIR